MKFVCVAIVCAQFGFSAGVRVRLSLSLSTCVSLSSRASSPVPNTHTHSLSLLSPVGSIFFILLDIHKTHYQIHKKYDMNFIGNS